MCTFMGVLDNYKQDTCTQTLRYVPYLICCRQSCD